MIPSRERWALAGLVAGILLLVVMGCASLWSTRALRVSAVEDQVVQAQLTSHQALLADVNDVVLAQRGFAITGDDTFLAQFEAAAREVSQELAALRRMTAPVAAEARLVAELDTLVPARLAMAREVIARRRSGGFEAARRLVASGEGRHGRLAIWESVRRLDQLATARWRREASDTDAAARLAMWLGGGAGGVAVGLLVLAAMMVHRELRVRVESEADLVYSRRLYMVLSDTNQLVVRTHDAPALLQGACAIAVRVGGYAVARVLLADPSDSRLSLAAVARGPDAPPSVNLDAPWAMEAEAIQSGIPVVAAAVPGWPIDDRPQAGFRGAVAVPLLVDGHPVGVFTVARPLPGAREADELRLFKELGLDLGFALSNLRRNGERDLALESSEAAEARLTELTSTIEDVFWVTDPVKSQVLYISPGYDRLWGRPRQALYTKADAWLEAVHPDDRDRLEAALPLQLEGPFVATYRIVRPDGAVRWIQARAFPVRGPSGEVLRVVGAARDITEQRDLEEQLRRAQKLEAVGHLAGGIAHDFNNLLTVILSYAELIHPALPPDLAEDCREIQDAAQRARELTRQLLAFSRRQVVRPEPVDLNTVLQGTEKMLRRLIGEPVTLEVVATPEPAIIHGDRGQLEQVLLNLAVNARDAMPQGGTLRLATRLESVESPVTHHGVTLAPGEYVILSVSDTGTGMDAETQAHLFEPFFTTKPPGQGTGLGLSTVYGIVKQSGGDIWLYSEPGRGTTFRIYLPRSDGAPVPVAQADASPLALGAGERILVVEDDDRLRAATERILVQHGYRVMAVRSGEEAIAHLSADGEACDLLLSDVVLPGASGPEIVARLRQTDPTLRALFVSGYVPEMAAQYAPLEARHLVQKPFTVATLLRRVREALAPPASAPV